MTTKLICSWLGLADSEWPPDHYHLLGLEPGEGNTALIEQRAQQRLDSVRRYQMMYPELATEAMNRLAQALVCLTEPNAKKQYDAVLLAGRSPAQAPSASPKETVVQPGDTGKFRVNKPASSPALPAVTGNGPAAATGPPAASAAPTTASTAAPAATVPVPVKPPPLPVKPPPLPVKPPPLPASTSTQTLLPERVPPLPPLPPLPVAEPTPTQAVAAVPPVSEQMLVPLERVDPILEAARSPEARRGLGSRRSLYRRIQKTRHLLHLWEQAGKYLANPQKRIKRQTAQELDHTLTEIQDLLPSFRPRLGQAGQPGYLVASQAHQEIFETFEAMDLNQRQALSQDWQAGHQLLKAHCAFLRQEVKGLRRQNFQQRLVRRLRGLVERPSTILLLLAGLALSVAIVHTFLGWKK